MKPRRIVQASSLVLFLVLLGLSVASVGCNTFRGLGRDLSNAGDAITEAAGGTP